MKTAKERAMQIVYQMCMGSSVTYRVFMLMVDDDSAVGKDLRDKIKVITEGIEEDRTCCAQHAKASLS